MEMASLKKSSSYLLQIFPDVHPITITNTQLRGGEPELHSRWQGGPVNQDSQGELRRQTRPVGAFPWAQLETLLSPFALGRPHPATCTLEDIAGPWATGGELGPLHGVGHVQSHGTLPSERALSSAIITLTFLIIFEQGALRFQFALGSTNYVEGLGWADVMFS